MAVNVQYDQQMQEQARQNAERQQKQFDNQDDYEKYQRDHAQNLYDALSAQRDGVALRWQKAMSDLRKAKQEQFNERMQWQHLDSQHLDKLIDGTTDWLSDAFRQKYAEQRRVNWDPKQHINADSKPYKLGFYLGMALGNGQARNQMLKKVKSNAKLIHLNTKVNNAQRVVDEIKKEKLPGLNIDADYAVKSAPKYEDAVKYANASKQERLNGHMPLTPEIAGMEYVMARHSAFDEMKKPGADQDAILKNLHKFDGALANKAKHDHLPAEALGKGYQDALMQDLLQDPKQRLMYQETSSGELNFENGQLTNNGKPIDYLTLRKPQNLNQYMMTSFKDFKAARHDLHADPNADHSDVIKRYRNNMFKQADLAGFDNDVSAKSVMNAMKAGTLTSSMDASMHYYQKKFGKDKGTVLAQQSFAFAQNTLAYKSSDVEGAAKQFAKDNRIKGVSQKDQVQALMYAHDYTQDSATLTGLDPNTVNEFYSLEAKDLFKGSEQKFNMNSLKYFNGDNLQKAVSGFDQNVLYHSGNFVDHPLESPGKVLEKALNEAKQAGGDTRDLQSAYDAFTSLGTVQGIKKRVNDSKAKNKAKKQETVMQNVEDDTSKKKGDKHKKNKDLGEKTRKLDAPKAEKEKAKSKKPDLDNDPVFGNVPNVATDKPKKTTKVKKYGPVLEKAKRDKAIAEGKTTNHKELLPSLEEMNPALAANIKKQNNPEKQDDEFEFHH